MRDLRTGFVDANWKPFFGINSSFNKPREHFHAKDKEIGRDGVSLSNTPGKHEWISLSSINQYGDERWADTRENKLDEDSEKIESMKGVSDERTL